jgi:hypothetical protein
LQVRSLLLEIRVELWRLVFWRFVLTGGMPVDGRLSPNLPHVHW